MNTVHKVDCLPFMKEISDNYYDLAIVDPPYGIQKKLLTGFKNNDATIEWDQRPGSEYFKELFRISKNQIIWGMQYFAKDLPDFSQLIIWDKGTGSNYFADGEAAFCSIKGTLRIFKHQWCGCFKDSERKEKAIHVNQKPIALYKWLLINYAKTGFKIFDSHVGSGSSRIACYDLKFYFEGCENDSKCWEDQDFRFQEYTKDFKDEYIEEKLQGWF